MTSSNEQIRKDHNLRSPATEKLIIDGCNELAAIDAQRAELNDLAAEIRAGWKDAGLLPAAVMSKYAQFKKLRTQKEEYTQSEEIAYDALNKANTGDMFKDLAARDARLEEQRQAAKKKKEEAKKDKDPTGVAQAKHLQKHIN